MNYILGSGLVGLMAKDILGDDWELIPHGTSRYYSFPVALADDFMPVSPRNNSATIITPGTKVVRRAFSMGGELVFAPLQWIADLYTAKVYDEPVKIFNKVVNMEEMVATESCHKIYETLLGKYMETLTIKSQEFGGIIHISKNEITTERTKVPYENAISTIPLDALMRYIGIDHDLQSKDVWVYHVRTNGLDFEGATQVLVADPEIDFYKVNQVGRNDYVFFCLNKIETPTEYFAAFVGDSLIVMNPAGTLCSSFIPLGGPTNLKWLKENFSIQCIGSHAQWDALADIGTCLVRILNLSI